MRMNYRKGKDGEQSEVFYTLRDFVLWLLVSTRYLDALA